MHITIILNKMKVLLSKLKSVFWYKLIFKKFGKRSVILNPLMIRNSHRISIGESVFIRDGVRLEVIGNGNIIIGDLCSIEQGFHITSGELVHIGSNVIASFGGMITDIDHNYQEIGVNILHQGNAINETKIGDFCFIGAAAKIQAGTVLGKQCIVGANSVVRGIFPDYCVIVGAPARIVKRYNFQKGKWLKTDSNGGFIDEVE
ncbi:acyltransferase [Pectobacterium brasiliense]|uniref:Acyltransferase n=1 Tax=Pectobacterium brasiliense TaxID=180957 RepID=A0AAE2WBY4_9GAMM|nr:acyltransferase [Pectobacterium brasiliense]MBN3050472.1 acyltransferase [Pectobacterium brasiliense]